MAKYTKKENPKNNGGRPRNIKEPKGLLKDFENHYIDYVKKNKLITITSFMMYLKDLKKIKNLLYWYELPEEFTKTKKQIESMIEQRYIEMALDKDNATSFLIFYGKNKFGYTDRLETHNTNVELPTINIVEDK